MVHNQENDSNSDYPPKKIHLALNIRKQFFDNIEITSKRNTANILLQIKNDFTKEPITHPKTKKYEAKPINFKDEILYAYERKSYTFLILPLYFKYGKEIYFLQF